MNDITALPTVTPEMLASLKLSAMNLAEGEMMSFEPAVFRALVEALEKAQAIHAAAEKLVRCKGRYHSEQNYRALAALFSVTVPELPPLESESRTVTASQSDYFASLVALARVSADKAMKKFPQPNYVLLKVAEEAGEVVQAGVHYAEKRMEWEQVEGEIVQLLAMLIRLVTEGDQINGITPPTAGIQVIEGEA